LRSSSVLSVNKNDWLTVERKSVGSVGVSFYINYDVVAGDTYYLMLKPVSSGSCGCADYSFCSGDSYGDGNMWSTMYYGSFHESGFDTKFWLQGVIDYGASFEVSSAGASPDHIESGDSTTIQWSVHSPTGGNCNIAVYGNEGTQLWHTEIQTFSEGETKTGSYDTMGANWNAWKPYASKSSSGN